jgi:membrane protein implicated in regulation of membrane protease activity
MGKALFILLFLAWIAGYAWMLSQAPGKEWRLNLLFFLGVIVALAVGMRSSKKN